MEKKNEKGITSIVAVVLLIAIAVVAGISVYFWMAGVTTKQPTSQTPVPIVANPIKGTNKVLVANLGQKTINASTIKTSGGNITCPPVEIKPGEQVLCEINASGTVAVYGEGTGSSIITVPGEGSTGAGPVGNQPPSVQNYWDNTGGKIENGKLVTFYANVSDPDGNLDKVVLYTNITGSWNSYEMALQSGNTYYKQLNANLDGQVLYYVYANDTKGATTTTENKSFIVYTPGTTVQWYKTYDWNGDDVIVGLLAETSGIYMTGYQNPGHYDIKTAKADLSGNLIWNHTVGLGNSYNDLGRDIAKYGDTVYISAQYWINNDHWHDNVILRYNADTGDYLGYTASDWTNGGYDAGLGILILGNAVYSTGYGDNPARSGEKDANLLKADLSGNKQFFGWTYDSGGNDFSNKMTTDGTYIYTTGRSNGADTLLQKIAQDGTVIYNKVYDFGNGQTDWGTGIVFLNNFLFITGIYYDSSTGHYNLYLSKLDLDGNVQFTKKYDLGADLRTGKIATDGTYIYGVGRLSNANEDGVLFKLDQDGNLVWKEVLDLGGNESLSGISIYNGLIYTGGYTDINGNKDWLLVVWKEN